jgi:phosphatidylglycerol:prolipoprotein diacylglycerol transferase
LVAYWHARRNGVDFGKLLDSVAPSLLVAQALARPANFINQELYGPPTSLPWGISIDAAHRIAPWRDLDQYPVETTRFHPTFAYEMLWNLSAAALLFYVARRFPKLKSGSIFAGWLILAGLGRFIIEWFRPDQPRIPGTAISYSRLIAALMFLGGTIWLLIQYGVIGRSPSHDPATE